MQAHIFKREKASISYRVIKFVSYLDCYQNPRLFCSQQVPGSQIHGPNDKETLVLCCEIDMDICICNGEVFARV
jgi:hypothetical protein